MEALFQNSSVISGKDNTVLHGSLSMLEKFWISNREGNRYVFKKKIVSKKRNMWKLLRITKHLQSYSLTYLEHVTTSITVCWSENSINLWHLTAEKVKLSIEDFFSKCDKIRSFQRVWSHLLKKSLRKTSFFVQCLTVFIKAAYAFLKELETKNQNDIH